MCVANLKVSTQPCNHRWAHLVRPCQSSINLSNCPERLKLEGWETRVDSCPFCGDEPFHESTHRLFLSPGSPISSSGPSSPDVRLATTRPQRSASLGTISSLSRRNSANSTGEYVDRGQWHREMNDRLLRYMTAAPHEVLPGAKRNYPTYSSSSTGSSSAREESTASDAASVRSASISLSRAWKKGMRLGRLKS